MKRPLTKVEKIGGIVIIIVIVMYFYINKIYEPVSQVYKAQNENLMKIEQEIQAIGNIPDNAGIQEEIDSLQYEYDGIKFDLDLLKQEKVQTDEQITNVLVDINKLMIKNKVDLNHLRWIEENVSNQPIELPEGMPAEAQQQLEPEPEPEQIQEEQLEQNLQSKFKGNEEIEWIACELEFTGRMVPVILFFNDLYEFESLVEVSEITLTYDTKKDAYRAVMRIAI